MKPQAFSRDLLEYLETLGYDPRMSFGALPTEPRAVSNQTASTQHENLDGSQAKTHSSTSLAYPRHRATPSWDLLEQQAIRCTLCDLSKTRQNVVFGVGDRNAKLMFVGEAPGANEDLKGEPFVGQAGELLNKMIEAMGLSRARVYIANVVKCRPPQNRNPAPDEVASCSPLLKRQIELVGPDVIVALGSFASRCLLNEESPIAQLRGRFAQCRFAQKSDGSPIFVMPTFHPAYLLRNPEMKKPAWEDLKQVMARLAL